MVVVVGVGDGCRAAGWCSEEGNAGSQAAARQHESARCRCMGGRQGVCSGSTRGRLGQAGRGLAIGLLQGRCVGSVWVRVDAGWQSGRTQATGAVRVQLWCGWQPIVVRVRGVGISGLKRGLHRRAHVCAAFLRARKPGGMQGRGGGWVLGEGTPRSLFSHALLQLTMDSSVSFTRCVVHQREYEHVDCTGTQRLVEARAHACVWAAEQTFSFWQPACRRGQCVCARIV